MYFDKPGKKNTKQTLEIALETALKRGISSVVVASCSGATVGHLKDVQGIQVVCVTHVQGFSEKGKNEMPDEVRAELQAAGVKTLTTTHVLSGAERGISRQFGGAYPVEIMANTLRMFGQGLKVCVEVAVMALDAGLIEHGKPVIAVGGTEEGADTAVLLIPANASHILETRICEILCKPSLL